MDKVFNKYIGCLIVLFFSVSSYAQRSFLDYKKVSTVRQSIVMPWYGDPGLGTQYHLYTPVSDMIRKDWIKMINDPLFGK